MSRYDDDRRLNDMLSNDRTAKMLCELFILCGQYKSGEITKEQFIARAEKLADEKLKAEKLKALKG